MSQRGTGTRQPGPDHREVVGEISERHETLGTRLGCHHSDLQVFRKCENRHLHDERDRESERHIPRKLNRQRSVFPSAQALLKALYPATFEATKKWSMTIRNWGQVYGELSIMYEDRLPE